jgi:zona occludens toxin
MINLLMGPPGGGKSYEATVYHILPALEKGRKVITNLPLDLDYIGLVNPDFLALIEIRQGTRKQRPEVDWVKAESNYKRYGIAQKVQYFNQAAFSHAEDYGDAWRHPETGAGPLYVVDECHIPLPRLSTELAVEHWYSLHRHESADVLLITQSYGKINRAILDLVQVCYRVKKNTSFGSEKTYIRKVQDGIRGEVVNTSIRSYEKQYFPFYKSHTRGGGAELAAQDIVPIWMRWPFIGTGICFLILALMFIFIDFKNPLDANSYTKGKKSLTPVETLAKAKADLAAKQVQTPPQQPSNPAPTQARAQLKPVQATEPEKPVDRDPYEKNGIHLLGHVSSKSKPTLWLVTLSQNGSRIKNISAQELVKVGYQFEPIGDCAAWLTYKTVRRFITCDTPSVTVNPAVTAQS